MIDDNSDAFDLDVVQVVDLARGGESFASTATGNLTTDFSNPKDCI